LIARVTVVGVVPAEYNDRSTLSAEVSPDGGNEYEFKLKGQR